MEERSNNITQTNDENRDKSSDQNVHCDICARTFRTNRALLQHLNFCRRRSKHEGDSPNGNIQTNNINHENLNDNEGDEINNATNSRQNNQNENQEYFYWNDVAGTQFENELKNFYEKIVHWKRNLYMLPRVVAGKNHIEEVTRG